MIISKLIKCFWVVVFFLLFGAMIMGSTYQEGPILDNSVLPGYYLHGFDIIKQDISDYAKDDNRFKKFKKIKSINYLDEMWLTVTKKEAWDSFFDEKKRKELNWSSISVARYYLDNKEEASEWAKPFMEGTSADVMPYDEKWSAGGYSVPKIGDKCWSDKAYRAKLRNGNGLMIYFIKGNTVVMVSGAGPDNKPMDPRFVEKIAQIVESRL